MHGEEEELSPKEEDRSRKTKVSRGSKAKKHESADSDDSSSPKEEDRPRKKKLSRGSKA